MNSWRPALLRRLAARGMAIDTCRAGVLLDRDGGGFVIKSTDTSFGQKLVLWLLRWLNHHSRNVAWLFSRNFNSCLYARKHFW